MIQTFYITISCENRKKERKFPTRIKLNHIGFFSFFFGGGGGEVESRVVIREVDGGGLFLL